MEGLEIKVRNYTINENREEIPTPRNLNVAINKRVYITEKFLKEIDEIFQSFKFEMITPNLINDVEKSLKELFDKTLKQIGVLKRYRNILSIWIKHRTLRIMNE